ncbi:MAG TPA: efflux RND transporter periplasmic adaptor subunit, partial [Bradyrhizobium sp.]|nr:efflux RND transporter periplasmic adaptor subunit [Bradyrhizobium sp.]
MMRSRYLKPALAVVLFVVFGAAWYWIVHRPRPEEKQTSGTALVIVTKSTNACFSDMVRGTGYIVPRREAVVGVDQEGSRVSEVLVREGEMVTDNQELARLSPASAPGGARPSPGANLLRAPVGG